MTFARFLRRLLFFTFLLSLVGSYFAWNKYKPQLDEVLVELKDKDPDKYEQLIVHAKGFDIKETQRLYEEIKSMTREQVLYLRYNKLAEKRKKNKDFRIQEWEKELTAREETRKEMADDYESRSIALKVLRKKDPEKLLAEWKRSEPWQKGELLREKCIQYLETEKKESVMRQNMLDLPRTAPLIEKPGQDSHGVSEVCARLVPPIRDEKGVVATLAVLKKEMNYYYFVRMVEDIGLPPDTVFDFDYKLSRMATDYSDL
ncbi:MAG: hypothetical protein COV67_10760 [Nitrospinae bacterium CG11_big_fil_rev_8_21_14_0_20_56_8]|nr:MAG: hypothetical protein COV67_10760 [Nitrospinae bacterium CG11_big_fil_rev_8_21_14_0_20_56_8]